jgi:hypothetical protein
MDVAEDAAEYDRVSSDTGLDATRSDILWATWAYS